ncbi:MULTISPECIES: DHA2 family efflux MFS transporter permease subunit [Aeribacillus]|uniref:DHA2 family efflux MFS transporter permease subunit n=1 Tax=Aeribacillus TaxID=1055323 RepID=UPI0007B4943B|nr:MULTISPECIES: DHA2 family efflux MFS transporter permease subunit [Aeribacillus]KZM57814.1 multidrug MFS transporter [Aeribacillus pallidus]MED0649853.1 DHA2 family efflux MFS transporter permease subunit [Aeribacillus composti]MED0704387.1 DHA2 family efflux MFS transporter permease subunit [Aeribacillus composti]MED4487826.1 DHA2 family efflux MFS transporter permease subunit [Aeribacillus pallidus]TVZ80576.1 EmrB/QacA subfamily drug resistance transporter [Aeribacillus composti]
MGEERDLAQETFNKVPLMIVLMSGAFVAILNQTLLGTALPHLMMDFKVDANTVQWLQSIFMLVNGIMIPITAFLIGRFTTRGLFLTAIGIFAVGTAICAIAPNFSVLMAGRVAQAAGAGIIMPLMQTILFLIFPVEKRGTAMGMFGLVIAFAPAIGPTLSGYLVEHFAWRSLFYVLLPIVVIDLILAFFILKNVTRQTYPKIDILSIILSTLGFGGLLYGFSAAGSSGWGSGQVILSLFIGLITLTWFIIRQLQLDEPILEFKVFKSKTFSITTVLGMIVFLSMIGGAVILPMFMQNMLGFSAFESGLVLLPGALVQGVANPITGRLFDKFGAKWLAIIGFFTLTITTFMLSHLTLHTTFTYLAAVNAFRMVGVAMVMMPVTTAGLNQLPTYLISHGTAMNNTMRQVAGAVGTALLVTVMTNTALPEKGIEGMIHGVNISFVVAGIFSAIALILSFFMKNSQAAKDESLKEKENKQIVSES